ncbi:short-chain dehydrogenase/reductase SDR [Actinosynnema mirum DSM 43827]|uniref:2,3-dihydro-2,3-dihydroxybenzoate dehydrogenase n=1 Tax=Actinosynnema mirum (strain ATCC 29888 / DSM 43827 / JCM 3225 / NBRC 14064 / NCIMB 13271 / NRRL B-12336 / IMRU 3971 / 101) TaxID=446462 RepID=C6WNZ3_ACTMD|nr:short-chain dehydrogenase/reductase SDR [Actinosynnema mirum DSM 43827]AXX30119.1 2,3-dihydro-2,3-dihydroxybenzoate dehydrogenase [Actinosynnema pretiosum subsp. pretiosum]
MGGNGVSTADFAGKTALVTGGASGIGAAVAQALAVAGARVASVDLHDAPSHGNITGYLADVTDPGSVERVIADAERELGPIDVGVSAAGVLRGGELCGASQEDWAATFAVNATGAFTVLSSLARRMVARRSGALVLVGSNAAGVPRSGMGAYAASKAAATMMARCLGLEVAEHGVRCNVVSPGSTDTPMQRALWTDGNGPERVIAGDLARYRVGIPLKRIADPEDIAEAVLFLASDRARHITMQDLYVDGGATLRA